MATQYVALRELTLRDGSKARPGQVIAEATDWPAPTIRAHLNLEWIKEAPAQVAEALAPAAVEAKAPEVESAPEAAAPKAPEAAEEAPASEE
jgi:hypothetical protein